MTVTMPPISVSLRRMALATIVSIVPAIESVNAQGKAPSAGQSAISYDIERGLAFAKKILSDQASADATKQKTAPKTSLDYRDTIAPEVKAAQEKKDATLEELKRLQNEVRELELAIEARKELARLERTFKYDEVRVRHYLSALFAPGRSQPVKGKMLEITTTTGPVSLKALREFGALQNSTDGLLRLGWVGCDPTNDRGRHAFPKNVGGSLDDQEAEFLAPAQELLLKYEKLLVAKGLLAP